MNCKPGDLAIFVDSLSHPRFDCYLGRIFEVVQLEQVDEEGWIYWHVRAVGSPVMADGLLLHEFAALDEALRPISGLPDAEDTDERQALREAA